VSLSSPRPGPQSPELFGTRSRASALIWLAILANYGYNIKTKREKLPRFMKTLSVEEIKTRLNEGSSDEELMRAYGLTPEELKALYDQFIKAMADGSLYVHISHDQN
jgi:hypothetical protein